jgi:uncharacterized phage protein gp47/JayE
MPFTIPTFAAILADLVADFQNRFPGANVSRLSGHWKRLAVFAGGAAALYRYIQVVSRDVMPDTAAAGALDRWLSIYGLARKGATSASAVDVGRVTGTVAATFASGTQLTSPDGLIFQLNESGSIPVSGYADVDIAALSTGAATRKSRGTVLTFVTPPAGIDSTVVLVADLDVGGADSEDDGSARVRLLDQIAQPAMGGAANDFRAWAKEDTNVGEAYVYPTRGGLGSVHTAALKTGHGSARLLSGGERTALQILIDSLRPVGYPDSIVLEVLAQDQDVEMLIEPEEDPVYAFHWADSIPLEVSSYDPVTRILVFTTDRPVDLEEGDRLFWRSAIAPFHDGSEVTVEALNSTDGVVLKAPLPTEYDWAGTPPAAGDLLYSGGPLVTSVRAAVVAYMDNLGPGRVDTASTAQDYSYGSSYWEGTLRLAKLHNLAQKQRGVLDSVVLDPPANVAPTNEAPAPTVSVLVPRIVIIRKRW